MGTLSRTRRGLLTLIVAAGASTHAQAPADLRVALVIGNAAYAAAPLANPANDAKAMSAALTGMGFSVIELRDASKAQMEAALARARDTLKGKNGVGLLYYAGHGLQLDWRNYMVPVDAKISAPADVPAQALDLQQVIDAFRAAGNRMNIVVLDACRDNPFGATASAKGLAPMDAPPGTFLAYATAPGNVAEDGTEQAGNGLYTQFLVKELQQPATSIENVFKRVRLQVRKQSAGRQIPWESTSLEEDFYFDSGKKVATASERQKEAAFAKEKADWDKIKDSRNAEDFYAYLQAYPAGLISEQAQFRLDQLQKAGVSAQARADGVKPLATGAARYAVGDVFVVDVIDGFTKATRRVERRVTYADDTRVEFDGGESVSTQMGGLVRNFTGTKDPPIMMQPADIAVGKRWRSAFTNTTPTGVVETNFYEFRVVALEDVKVPAGTFKAYRVERSGEARRPGGFSRMTGTMWIDPTTMLSVRNDTMFRSGGKIDHYDSNQWVSYRPAAR
jgi:Caspase domain